MSDYDISIHSSRDAREWATLFIDTWKDVNRKPDLDVMIGWFANAMMAMHDSIHQNEIQTLEKIIKVQDDALGLLTSKSKYCTLRELNNCEKAREARKLVRRMRDE